MASPHLTELTEDELIEEILLRIPPDEPSCFARASLACKPWRRIILDRRFRQRLQERHGSPPVLGFLRNNGRADFVTTTSSAFSLAVPAGKWRALDCRHGRALLLNMAPGSEDLLIWDPITGDQEHVTVQVSMWDETVQATAAIVCAAAGCDHRGCHGKRPFRLVMVYCDNSGNQNAHEEGEDVQWYTWACSYSSDTEEWGDATWVQDSGVEFTMHTTSMLVGGSLLYFLSDQGDIIEYNLAGRENATTIAPPLEFEWSNSAALILTDDGGLGLVETFENSRLNIWSRVDLLWVKSRVIRLDVLLPPAALGEAWPISFAERAEILFIRTPGGIFTMELRSQRARKVCEDGGKFVSLVPIEVFYTPRTSPRRIIRKRARN